MPFVGLGPNQVFVPEADDGTSSAIPLPEYGFPFWSTNKTQVFVSTDTVTHDH